MDPPGQDELLDQLWELCGGQDARACKDLAKHGPADSVYVKFGISCGGRSVAPCARLFADLQPAHPYSAINAALRTSKVFRVRWLRRPPPNTQQATTYEGRVDESAQHPFPSLRNAPPHQA